VEQDQHGERDAQYQFARIVTRSQFSLIGLHGFFPLLRSS
jgi:hypothetical protein